MSLPLPVQIGPELETVVAMVPGQIVQILMYLVNLEIGHRTRLAQSREIDSSRQVEFRQTE